MNYGWQFYRNYYKGIERFPVKDKYTDAEKEEQAQFFKGKNRVFEKQKPQTQADLFFQNRDNQGIKIKTTYPGLLIGTGYGHGTGLQGEFKLGFFFDHTTGLPIVSGSSVKGKLRSVFPNFNTHLPNLPDNLADLKMKKRAIGLAKAKAFALYVHLKKRDFKLNPFKKEELEDPKMWEYIHKLELAIFEGLDVNQSLGRDTPQYLPMREHDVFHDAFVVHIEKTLFENDAITPHGKNPLKNPIPIAFLKIAPNVTFQFNFDLKNNGLDIDRKVSLFKYILEQQGIGAKTNVGYGQLK